MGRKKRRRKQLPVIPEKPKRRRRPSHHITRKQKLFLLHQAVRRTCLRCQKPFPSNGPWNRICPTCKDVNEILRLDGMMTTYHSEVRDD